MTNVSRLGILTILFVWCILSVAAQEQPFNIRHRARAVHPGEVIVLEIFSSDQAMLPRVTFAGEMIRLFPSPDGTVLHGLLGLDLEMDPGDYQVTVSDARLDGKVPTASYILTVLPKQFPTRELRVEPRFVNPPQDVVARIQREAQTVADIFDESSPERLWSGGFVRPVQGEATSSFGRRSVFNGQPRRPHSGTDFRAAEGTPVRAPNTGRVALAGNQYFSGNVVILDHGWGLFSHFAHLSTIDVKDGDFVSRGEVIGKVGATGRVTGPHLHWTVRLNEARVDPIALMRLFPLDRSEQ